MRRDDRMTKRLVVIVVSLFVLASAGCSGPRPTGPEAVHRIDSYLKQAIDAAPTDIHLTQTEADTVDASGGCPSGQVEAVVKYVAKHVPSDTAQGYLDSVYRLWKSRWGGVAGRVSRGPIAVLASVEQFGLSVLYESAPETLHVEGTSECLSAGPGQS